MSYELITPDQVEGAKFLAARPVALLGDKAGFGKTPQFILASELVNAKRITLVCPPVLKPQEAAEFIKWSIFSKPVTIIDNGKSEVPVGDGVVIVAYSLIRVNERIRKALVRRGCDVLIIEESHATKDPKAAQTKALFLAKGLASTAKRIWFVTATPALNHPGDWFIFAKVSGAWQDTYNNFVDRYCELERPPDPTFENLEQCARILISRGIWKLTFAEFVGRFSENGALKNISALKRLLSHCSPRIVGSKNETELKALLAPYVLARDKIDPERAPLTVDTIPVDGKRPDFSDVPADTLEAIEAAIAAESWHELDGPAVATVRRHIGIAKAEAVCDLIACELIDPELKILVFCQHTAVIDALAERFGAIAGIVDGRHSDKRREESINEFQNGSKLRILICQQQALREGRTLTAANRVLLIEPPWTPDICTQLIARAWRRGQKRHTRASFVYLSNSPDSRVSATLARKANDLAKISLVTTE